MSSIPVNPRKGRRQGVFGTRQGAHAERRRASFGLSTKIAVAGCVAQAEGAEILRKQRAVDLVVGPQSYHRLPELLRQSDRSRQ